MSAQEETRPNKQPRKHLFHFMFTKVKQPEFLCIHRTLSSHQQCIVQINLPHSSEQKFINMQRALDNDPDLASIPRENLFLTFQLLSIVSVIDYISYFCGIGKAAFLNVFYQHSPFIKGIQEDGHLSDINTEINKGFLAFIRLVGTVKTFVRFCGFEIGPHTHAAVSCN